MARTYSHTELGMGYGIVVGGAMGIALLLITGSAVWLGLTFAIGLIGGMIWGQHRDDRESDADRPRASRSSRGPDDGSPGGT